jgi:hypothetical protein
MASSPTRSRGTPLDDRRGFDRQVRFGRILGLVFCVAGFTTIGFGWNGTAKTALVDKQFPYLISGGAAGVALVLLGVGLLVMSQVRSERLKLAEELRTVASVISRAVAAAPSSSSLDGRVVAGKSTYHRPDCRLVEKKSDLDFVTVGAAKATGLSPCRVCNPDLAGTADGADPETGTDTAAAGDTAAGGDAIAGSTGGDDTAAGGDATAGSTRWG